MPTSSIGIHIIDIATTVRISRLIPEFSVPYGEEVYQQRLAGKAHLLLAAEVNNQLAGFKAGYASDQAGYFYSWMGGILPDFRRIGIATTLANYQEEWAVGKGYTHIHMKTRNQHRNMLIFSISRGFQITKVSPEKNLLENRIYLEKCIKKAGH